METKEEFKKKVSELDDLRKKSDTLDSIYKERLSAFQDKNEEIIDAGKELKEKITHSEEDIKKSALEIYKERENKKDKDIGFGVKIQDRVKLKYDKERALNLAIYKERFLSLDKKEFEKFAKTTKEEIEFVEITKEPIATISKKLKLEE